MDAAHHGGVWLVRIDDLDSYRCKPEYVELILRTLDAFALHADESVIYQSERIDAYEAAFNDPNVRPRLYSCDCPRKSLPRGAYPGNCRFRLGQARLDDAALRLETTGLVTDFIDRYQGPVTPAQPGDFIVKRRDQLIAYQWACAIDERLDRISHVIRGVDLLPSTPMQRWVAECLNHPTVSYGHFPTLHGPDGSKLSKQTFAEPVDSHTPGQSFARIAGILGCRDTPGSRAQASEWVDYFFALGDPQKLLPKTPHLLVDARRA